MRSHRCFLTLKRTDLTAALASCLYSFRSKYILKATPRHIGSKDLAPTLLTDLSTDTEGHIPKPNKEESR